MKKIALTMAAALVLFASCKKDYTCSCTTTYTQVPQGGTPTTTSSTTTTTVKDVKKKYVTDEMECYSDEYTYTYDIGTPVSVTVKSTCTISK